MSLRMSFLLSMSAMAALALCESHGGWWPLGTGPDDRVSLLQTSGQVQQRKSKVFTPEIEEMEEGHTAPPSDPEVCLAGVHRLATVAAQKFTEADVGKDSLFPPDGSSIAPAGSSCGDTAAGPGAVESCDKYSRWATFQKVAEHTKQPFSVFDPAKGIEFTHIGQGSLGNCYFLAALAAIANSHPDMIMDMFVERSLWAKNIFKTRWFLDGKETVVTVDNMIPADDANTFFTHPSLTGEFWAVILAKTWAKIFGTFKSVEGGSGAMAVAAMTQAPPIQYVHSAKTAAENWALILDASTNKYPIVSSSVAGATKYGLAAGHAYAVLEASELAPYGKVLKMFNPWRRCKYKGEVSHTEEVVGKGFGHGVFVMKFEEYLESFGETLVTKAQAGYGANSMSIDFDQAYAVQIDTNVVGNLYVSINWPEPRLLRPCPRPRLAEPPTTIQVWGGPSNSDATSTKLSTTNAVTIQDDFNARTEEVVNTEVVDGKSTFFALVYAQFSPDFAYITEPTLSVYGPKDRTGPPRIRSCQVYKPKEVALGLFTPKYDCAEIEVPGHGCFTRDDAKMTITDIPTFWSSDKKLFLYMQDPKLHQWALQSGAQYDTIKDRTWALRSWMPNMLTLEKKDISSCKCDDA
jgi:hypothetical protein